jgi:hypothetical protein
MIVPIAGPNGSSPPSRKVRKENPLISRHEAGTRQRIREVFSPHNPISESATRKMTFVNTWRPWRLGGSDSVFESGLGLGRGVKAEGMDEGVAV